MFTRIDHLVILVRQLDDAIQTYRGLGFQVIPGGEHPGGTHNALVAFADGSYLELIAFQRPEQPHGHRWYRFLAAGGGLVDFALGADDVAAAVDQARAAGLDYHGPVPGARRRPDGQELAWRLGTPGADWTGQLPFLIDDVTPRGSRVPEGEQARQPNGVIGVRSVTVAVRDLSQAAAAFGRLLGTEPSALVEDGALRARTVGFSIGAQRIVLASPTDPSSPIAARIQQLGDGPYQITLVAAGFAASRRIDPADAEDARFVLEPAG